MRTAGRVIFSSVDGLSSRDERQTQEGSELLAGRDKAPEDEVLEGYF
jgi:hypothetical protein